MEIKAFFDEPTFTLTFVVSDEATKDAVVIDSVLNYNPLSSQTSTESLDELSDYVRQNGLHVHYALETHAHADHLSGAQMLKKRFDAKTAIGASITAVQEVFKGVFDLGDEFAADGRQFDKLIGDGETLQAGSLEDAALLGGRLFLLGERGLQVSDRAGRRLVESVDVEAHRRLGISGRHVVMVGEKKLQVVDATPFVVGATASLR